MSGTLATSNLSISLAEPTKEISITNDQGQCERLIKTGWILIHEPSANFGCWVFYKPIPDLPVHPDVPATQGR